MKRGRAHVHSEAEAVRRHRVEGTFHLDADDYSEEDIDKCRVEGRASMRTPVFAFLRARVFFWVRVRVSGCARVWPCAQL